ncbi:citrate-binding protein-like [Gastrolobium bilobum]|uniref:citrate-binding protein-like n=1 Tax=Gastrolobium bilobum TaxID=150636 RepID=UPI002AB28F92|nr:citrate-binding protein-like [Gastrolobium bilobum]
MDPFGRMGYICKAMVAVLNLLVCYSFIHVARCSPVDPTLGFTDLPLNQSNLEVQKPYNVPESERYSFVDGVHKMWVYSTDDPHSINSRTLPRTEIGIRGYGYNSGVWQFEGHGFVRNGTSGVCIMQVFGSAPPHATTFMLRTYNGSLTYYTNPVLVPNMWGRWFKLNVIHDVDASYLKIYIDGVLVYVAPGRGGTYHSFKFGVYAQDYDSYCMESHWKGIRVLKKCS